MSARNLFATGILLMSVVSFSATAQERLLIIAPDDFIDELEPLQRFKEATARSTTLLSLSEVYNSFAGADQPEKVKKCIYGYKEAHNIESVLLVGDCDKFPVRCCKGYNTEWGSMYFPSDLYYADLYASNGTFDGWDGGNPPYGGNKIYGEMDFSGFSPCDLNKLNLDRINMYPDVAVARVPASTGAEVTTYVDKVIRYELTAPGNWFKRALWVVDCDASAPAVKDRLDNYLTKHGFTIVKRYYDAYSHLTDAQRAAELNNVMNSNGVGFLNHAGHGGRLSWQRWYTASALPSLTNSNRLPVVYSVSCGTARFFWEGCGCAGCVPEDFYQAIDGTEWKRANCGTPTTARPEPMPVQPSQYDRESFAEEFLVKRDTGGIAYIGCTFKQEYGGDDLDKYFFEAYDVGPKPPSLGYMWNYALTEWMNNVNPCHYYAYIHMHKVMCFGDPSLRVGGAFTTPVSGPVSDAWLPYFGSYSRYRIKGNVTVPAGKALTADQGASILFEGGRKITAVDPGASFGFHVNGKPNAPVYLLATGPQPSSQNAVRGVKIRGQMRLRNGGAVKLY